MRDKVGESAAVRQLTLDFSEGFLVTDPQPVPRQITRTLVFPKHIEIPNFGRFQRQVNVLFAPLGISVEFRLTRQKRLEMKWIFPPETLSEGAVSPVNEQQTTGARPTELSSEELNAFETMVFSMAGAH